MNSKTLFRLIVPIAALSILGLFVAQIFWFKNAFRLKDQQFKDKVFVLLNHVGIGIEKNVKLQSELSDFLHSTSSDSDVSKASMPESLSTSLQQMIDSVFQANNLVTAFDFGIFNTKDCNDPELVFSNLPSQNVFTSPLETNEVLSCFIAGIPTNFLLSLSFPNKKAYLLRQTWGMLGLTFLLILILLVAFSYTLYVVQKQKKLSEIKNDFINNLSHEFKTPIASIALASKVLQKKTNYRFSAEDFSYLELISKESKRLENHIDKILQIAVMDSGNFSLEIDQVNLNEVIEKVAQSFDLLLQEKKGTLQLNLPIDHPMILADERHLFNMFYNLLDNAIKYSTRSPDIIISVMEDRGGFRFSIKDKGIGMDETAQQNIFEKFYRASSGNKHKVKGFGLGLSYVKSIVEAHRGTIRFSSALNQGTEFTILLPAS